jgi:hypothetical protein
MGTQVWPWLTAAGRFNRVLRLPQFDGKRLDRSIRNHWRELGLHTPRQIRSQDGCWENSCTGLSPTAQGCTATSTPGNPTIGNQYTIQLRWSAGCWTYWARAKQGTCSGSPIVYARMQRQLWTPYGYYDANVYYSGHVPCNGNYAVTAMVGDVSTGYRYRACVVFAYDARHPSNWPESWWYCVDWVYD